MYEEAKVLTHSSIKVAGEKILYFDPFEVADAAHDADIILITHDHYDHFSPADIEKVANEETLLILPECMAGKEKEVSLKKCKLIAPEAVLEIAGLMIRAIPAYNRMKPFHPKRASYVGYLVTLDGVSYYVAGDTDRTPENQEVRCEVAFLPVGGKFTMDYEEAAKLANIIHPQLAIPTHYGKVVGTPMDGRKFAELVDSDIEVRL